MSNEKNINIKLDKNTWILVGMASAQLATTKKDIVETALNDYCQHILKGENK